MAQRTTVEVVAVPCVCGKGVITATVSEVSAGVFRGRVEAQAGKCPACGSDDLKAARAKADAKKKQQP